MCGQLYFFYFETTSTYFPVTARQTKFDKYIQHDTIKLLLCEGPNAIYFIHQIWLFKNHRRIQRMLLGGLTRWRSNIGGQDDRLADCRRSWGASVAIAIYSKNEFFGILGRAMTLVVPLNPPMLRIRRIMSRAGNRLARSEIEDVVRTFRQWQIWPVHDTAMLPAAHATNSARASDTPQRASLGLHLRDLPLDFSIQNCTVTSLFPNLVV